MFLIPLDLHIGRLLRDSGRWGLRRGVIMLLLILVGGSVANGQIMRRSTYTGVWAGSAVYHGNVSATPSPHSPQGLGVGVEIGHRLTPVWAFSGRFEWGTYPSLDEAMPTDGLYAVEVTTNIGLPISRHFVPAVHLGVHGTTNNARDRISLGPVGGAGVNIGLTPRVAMFAQGTARVALPPEMLQNASRVSNILGYDALGMVTAGIRVAFRGGCQPVNLVALEGSQRAAPGDTVYFAAETAQGTEPLNYRWHFGDGTSSSDPHPSHVYSKPGTYTVRAQVSNCAGQTTGSFQTRIIGTPPAINAVRIQNLNLEQQPYSVDFRVNAPIHFSANISGMRPISYEWQFGDNTESVEQTPVHRYAVPGTYTVQLRVTNPTGEEDVIHRTLTVREWGGLYGDHGLLTQDVRGYTWVVGSYTSRAPAAQLAQKYRERGYYTGVLHAVVDSVNVYRVAVGQFANRSEAKEMKESLPREAPPTSWVVYIPGIREPDRTE